MATQLGATTTHLASDFEPDDVAADIAIDSSGSAIGVAAAVRGLGRRGHLVLLGLLPAGENRSGPQVITRELTVAGSFRFHSEMRPVIAALSDGSLHVSPVVSHLYPLEAALEAFAMAQDSARSGEVLLTFDGADTP